MHRIFHLDAILFSRTQYSLTNYKGYSPTQHCESRLVNLILYGKDKVSQIENLYDTRFECIESAQTAENYSSHTNSQKVLSTL